MRYIIGHSTKDRETLAFGQVTYGWAIKHKKTL